jgi:hypothetical protein
MKNLILRPGRWALAHRRRVVVCLLLALLILLGAHPNAHASDVYSNIGPAPQLPPGGWFGRYPLNNYALDQYFPAISVGFTSGVDASGVAPMIAYFGAQVIWQITAFLASGVILLFGLAFNLDLVNGDGRPGSGALAPVSQAIHNLYTSTFGAPWLIAMVVLVGCWAMWKALIQRRYTETASALAVSLLYFVLAVGIVTQPERTIGPASKLSNQLSSALLSLTSEGSVSSEAKAKTGASNQLFELLVLDPWTVLEFGGIEHCATVSHGKPQSVAVRPLSSDPTTDARLAGQLEHGTEVTAGAKTCINDRNKYAAHFLQFPPGSHRRDDEHEALEHGDDGDLPASDAGKTDRTYPLGPADEPAAEAMGKGGQYQRLLLAFVIALGEIGAFLLLGALAIGVIVAQVMLLVLLGFSPAALLIGIFPGHGHDFFRRWLTKLASYLARKVVYSLILAVVLAVCAALAAATSNLGWLLSFGLQAAFLWTVFVQRNKLTSDLLAGTLGPGAAREGTNRLQALYYSTRLARMFAPGRGGGEGRSASGPDPGAGGPPTPHGGSAPEEPPPAGDDGPTPDGAPTPTGEPSSGTGPGEELDPGESAPERLGGDLDPERASPSAESAEPPPIEGAGEAPDAGLDGDTAPSPTDRAEAGKRVEPRANGSGVEPPSLEHHARDAQPAVDASATATTPPAVSTSPTTPPEEQPAPPSLSALRPPTPQSAQAPRADRVEPDSSEPSTAVPSPTAEPVGEVLRERRGSGPEPTTQEDAPA